MTRLLAAVVVALALGAPAAGLAHSLLLESSPAAGASVAAPSGVDLRFNNRIEKRLCRLRVIDAAGHATALPVALDGPADRLRAALGPLATGAYRLEWQVLSTDGHVVTGSFDFRVAP